MTSWTDLALTALDTETTGVNIPGDRLVTACIAHIDGAQVAEHNWLLNPGIDIPAEAAAVHGITTEQAQSEGQDYEDGYRELRNQLETAWAMGRAVVAFNAGFDLSMIDAEGQRLGYAPLAVGLVIDPFTIDRHIDKYRKGKRTLAVTCEHYGVKLEGAHSSNGDALAAARLAYKLVRRRELANLTPEDLMDAQARWHYERQFNFIAYLQSQGKDPSDVSVDWPLRKAA